MSGESKRGVGAVTARRALLGRSLAAMMLKRLMVGRMRELQYKTTRAASQWNKKEGELE